jgi:hypothetical protein
MLGAAKAVLADSGLIVLPAISGWSSEVPKPSVKTLCIIACAGAYMPDVFM